MLEVVNSVYPLSGWSVELCKFPSGPQKVVCCVAQGCLLLLPPLAWGRRQPKASAWQEVKAELKKEKVAMDLEDSDRLDRAGGSSRRLCCPPIYSSSLPSQEPPEQEQDVLNLLPFPNWSRLFFLLEREEKKIRPAALSLLPSPLFPLGWRTLHFQAKVGLEGSPSPFPAESSSQKKDDSAFFPVGGMWSSPHLPPLFSPAGISLNMIAANPIPAEGSVDKQS